MLISAAAVAVILGDQWTAERVILAAKYRLAPPPVAGEWWNRSAVYAWKKVVDKDHATQKWAPAERWSKKP